VISHIIFVKILKIFAVKININNFGKRIGYFCWNKIVRVIKERVHSVMNS